MRGHPQAITRALPRATSPRRWSVRLAGAWGGWRRPPARRHEAVERLAREQRRAHAKGQYVHQSEYRVRPW